MHKGAGIIREESALAQALSEVAKLISAFKEVNLHDTGRIYNMLKRKVEDYKAEAKVDVGNIEVIPLFEDAFVQLKAKALLGEVFKGEEVREVRLFLGKSDSAVKHGHLASALAIAYTLSRLGDVESELGLRIRPILGMGSPPFRGGLNNPRLAPMAAPEGPPLG